MASEDHFLPKMSPIGDNKKGIDNAKPMVRSVEIGFDE
jgi:hypothetical protein